MTEVPGATTTIDRPVETTTTDEAATMIAEVVATTTDEVAATAAEGATTTTGALPSRPRVTTTTTEHPEGPETTRLLDGDPPSLLPESRSV